MKPKRKTNLKPLSKFTAWSVQWRSTGIYNRVAIHRDFQDAYGFYLAFIRFKLPGEIRLVKEVTTTYLANTGKPDARKGKT